MHKNAPLKIILTHCDSPNMSNGDIFSLHFTIFGPVQYNLDFSKPIWTRPKSFWTHKRTMHSYAHLEFISTHCDLPHLSNRDIFSLHFFHFWTFPKTIWTHKRKRHKNAPLEIIPTHWDSPHMSNRDIFSLYFFIFWLFQNNLDFSKPIWTRTKSFWTRKRTMHKNAPL